ncbi:4-hydroxy-tetrahydrodipicolinate reductase [Buchnera aphidicola (Muscaphis stroyani)]|uniref:4-hydroxy-tetrahydrodipicolinate reductase n=1 Tax=Buchnera aphidicola (Muscaphis stroyani) TaxID=1241869 RepID=A0A4D6YIJ2_9GAMM|nr:4-hydroxy-tetrahydrodipicolinate reductase [Buchnera aphidicola]QCI24245.1 4-hydroxy-tetrahydrodipicolinate reductase [Buchnera aphidicola (Muscaphis stroyani)]
MKKKTRIAISGPMGRMGKMLVKESQKNKSVQLTTVLVEKNHLLIGKDIGESIGIGKIGVFASDKINSNINDFDVLIDFTKPNGTLKYLKYCSKLKKNIVIGTTGFSNQEMEVIKSYSKKISIMISANFSIGINIVLNLIEKATHIIGNNSDIDIIEFHHRNKIDSPSGTALAIGKVISNAMNWNLDEHSLYLKKGINGIREEKKISFSSIRSGNTIGKHTTMFSNSNEQIKITHIASNRISFAQGAIQAAIWIHQKNRGLFNMMDVLKF